VTAVSEALCENCAGTDEDLVAVWPLAPAGSDTAELWCADCRDRFAHELAEDGEGVEED
jgi:hypothetical protein